MVSIGNITPFVKETIILNCSPYKCEVIYDSLFFFNDKSYFLIIAQRDRRKFRGK